MNVMRFGRDVCMQKATTIDTEDRLRVSIQEGARLLSIGKRQLEYRIANKQISTVRDGRRSLILMSELRRYGRTNHFDSARPRKPRK